MSSDETDGHEILAALGATLDTIAVCVSVQPAQKQQQQADLICVVGHEMQFQFEIVLQERRRRQTQIRRIAGQGAAELGFGNLHICNEKIRF